jgi:hypothetical protein
MSASQAARDDRSVRTSGEHPVTEPPPIPVRFAWRRYLDETSSATAEAYELVEQLAWRKLTAELTKLERPLDVTNEQP